MTKPIPDGYHTLTPHLVVRGAADAIEFYRRAFGAEELFRMTGPDGRSVLHAEIRIGDSIVMISEEDPNWDCRGPEALGGTPTTLHLYVQNVDAAFARAVEAGARVRMPVADMFWGDRYGQVVDPPGHVWSLATHVKDLSPDEIAAGAAQACGK